MDRYNPIKTDYDNVTQLLRKIVVSKHSEGYLRTQLLLRLGQGPYEPSSFKSTILGLEEVVKSAEFYMNNYTPQDSNPWDFRDVL